MGVFLRAAKTLDRLVKGKYADYLLCFITDSSNFSPFGAMGKNHGLLRAAQIKIRLHITCSLILIYVVLLLNQIHVIQFFMGLSESYLRSSKGLGFTFLGPKELHVICRVRLARSVVYGRSLVRFPAQTIFFLMNEDSHCNRIHFYLTADGYLGKQPDIGEVIRPLSNSGEFKRQTASEIAI